MTFHPLREARDAQQALVDKLEREFKQLPAELLAMWALARQIERLQGRVAWAEQEFARAKARSLDFRSIFLAGGELNKEQTLLASFQDELAAHLERYGLGEADLVNMRERHRKIEEANEELRKRNSALSGAIAAQDLVVRRPHQLGTGITSTLYSPSIAHRFVNPSPKRRKGLIKWFSKY